MDQQTQELLQRSKNGDTIAFGELYDLFADKIFRFILMKIKNKNEAEDLLQEIFIKAWQSIQNFDPARGNFNAWLYAISSNTINDFFRRTYRKPPTVELSPDQQIASSENIQKEYSLTDDLVALRKSLKKLPPQYQQVLELRFLEDLSIAETAFILGKSGVSVRVLQHRALKHLREIIQKEHHDLQH